MFSLNNLSKMNVLRVLDANNIIQLIKITVFWSNSCIFFSENPCANMQETQKSEKNYYVLYEQL